MEKLKVEKNILEEIWEFLEDENVTDINWNGRELWIDNLEKGRYSMGQILSKKFIEDLSTKLSNLMNLHFNKHNPVLEAETEDLRISIIHESVSPTGRSLSIRKSPKKRRLNETVILESGYCSVEILEFLKQAVINHCNIIIGGLPGVGKTEFLKYLTAFIPDHERVMTLEDNLEIRYSSINPGKDCVEIKVRESFDFDKAISASLRHNTKWTLLSEARGKEVFHLMNSLSDGTHCITTLHVEDVLSIPDRLLTMTGNTTDDRFINNIYSFIDVGLIIMSEIKGDGKIRRWLDQVAVFCRTENENIGLVIYEDGKMVGDTFNKVTGHKKRFKKIRSFNEEVKNEDFIEAV